MGFGVVELALPAGRLAEAQLREDLPGLVALLGREPQAPFQELARLSQVTGPQRSALADNSHHDGYFGARRSVRPPMYLRGCRDA
jgi:hypothetical protein